MSSAEILTRIGIFLIFAFAIVGALIYFKKTQPENFRPWLVYYLFIAVLAAALLIRPIIFA